MIYNKNKTYVDYNYKIKIHINTYIRRQLDPTKIPHHDYFPYKTSMTNFTIKCITTA